MIHRRRFLTDAAGLGAGALLGFSTRRASAEPPPETRRIRLPNRPVMCEAPGYVAEELLRGEGFTDISYLKRDIGKAEDALATGDVDIGVLFGPPMILRMDTGDPIVFLGGVHVGCAELFVNERIRTTRDLKGKTVAIVGLRDAGHALTTIIAAHVGLNPEKDVRWALHPYADFPRLLASGKVDAFLAGPPMVQEVRARKIGCALVNLLTDRPWSQYYCCMLVANREFVRRYPVATKRAMRAILKASEMCALQPDKIAAFLVDKGYVERNDYAVQAMRGIVYGKWREYDPEDAVRFYALRLYEGGMIKSSPQKILAQGTDWRFLNELRKEVKG
jgi:NitT/TauT family transport system substrate-binding protein